MTTANSALITPIPSPKSTPIKMTPKHVINHTTCKSETGQIITKTTVQWPLNSHLTHYTFQSGVYKVVTLIVLTQCAYSTIVARYSTLIAR